MVESELKVRTVYLVYLAISLYGVCVYVCVLICMHSCIACMCVCVCSYACIHVLYAHMGTWMCSCMCALILYNNWVRRRMLKISITLHLVSLRHALFPKTRTRLVANKKQQYYLYSSETHNLGVLYILVAISSFLYICWNLNSGPHAFRREVLTHGATFSVLFWAIFFIICISLILKKLCFQTILLNTLYKNQLLNHYNYLPMTLEAVAVNTFLPLKNINLFK